MLVKNIKVVITLGMHRIITESKIENRFGNLDFEIEVVNVDYLDQD